MSKMTNSLIIQREKIQLGLPNGHPGQFGHPLGVQNSSWVYSAHPCLFGRLSMRFRLTLMARNVLTNLAIYNVLSQSALSFMVVITQNAHVTSSLTHTLLVLLSFASWKQ